jgi:hypothetical protein
LAKRGRLAFLALGLVGAFGLGTAQASASVLDIGDSLTVGSEPTLKQIVPGIQIDAQVGRSSATGLSLLESEYGGQNVVVFDLGTNDDPSATGQLLAELQQIRRTIGNACLVLSTINRPPYHVVSFAGLNRVIENFALRDGNTQVVPWQLYTRLHPEVVYSDGVHVTPYGYEFRAHVLATAISACGGRVVKPSGGQSNLPPPASAGTQPPASAGTQPPAPAPPRRLPPKPVTKRMLVRTVASFVTGLLVDGVQRLTPGALRLP